jgi:hypothetical protein
VAADQAVVLVGLQSRYYDAAATAALQYEAEVLTPLDTSTKATGAAGASGTAPNVIRHTDLIPTWRAILKSEIDATNLALTHEGSFRIWARFYRPTSNTGAVSVRLEWECGDFRKTAQNDPVNFAAGDWEGQWTLVDLGLVHLTGVAQGAHRWEFRVLAKSTVTGDELDVDHFLLFPTGPENNYIELSGRTQVENPTSFLARDEFDQAAGGDLAGKLAPVGGAAGGGALTTPFGVASTNLLTRTAHGLAANDRVVFTALTGGTGLVVGTPYFVIATGLTANDFKVSATQGGAEIDFTTNITAGTFERPWSGAGDADDFSVNTTDKVAQRTSVSDANVNTGRYAVLGAANYAASLVQADVRSNAYNSDVVLGVLARYVDTNNWLRLRVEIDANDSSVFLEKRVAGTVTTLYSRTGTSAPGLEWNTWYSLRLLATARGEWDFWLWKRGSEPASGHGANGQDADLATGGALDDGKPGIYDANVGATATTRQYDNFFVFTPTVDAAIFAGQSLELRHDGAIREDAAGMHWQNISSRRGKYLKIPPAGQEGRSNRIIVKGVRGPTVAPGVILDPAIDDISSQLFVTPRGLVAPE